MAAIYPFRKLPNVIRSNIELSRLARNGALETALHLFDVMPQRTSVSWNIIISALSKRGRFEESLAMVSSMHLNDFKFSETTFSSALSSCARSSSFAPGKQLHCLVLKSGSEDFNLVGSALLNLYAFSFEIHSAEQLFQSLCLRNPLLWSLMLVGFVRCGMMKRALDLFEKMPSRDVVSWTAIISGYSRSASAGDCTLALDFFVLLCRSDEATPNEFTYDCVLRACSTLGSLDFGKTVHGCLVRCGFESDPVIVGALVELYCSCGSADDSCRVFDEMQSPTPAAANAMIAGFLSAGRIADAEAILIKLSPPCPFSCNQMIKAYALAGRTADAKNLFERTPHKNIVTLNTMLSVFHRAGETDQSLILFESIRGENNTVSWNSMISIHVQNEEPVEALKLYRLMQAASIESSRSTFSALLRACAAIGTLKQGAMLHARLHKSPFQSSVYVGTALVDMYAKCGSIARSRASFVEIESPNIASWTALISALAQHGSGTEAVVEFGRMLRRGIEPNEVTFVGLLMACGREGMVDQGMSFFHSMERCYDLAPSVEHYACVVDLLGRAGCVREAEEFILGMPIEADSVIWAALLSACWFYADLEVGERVAWRLLCLNSRHVSTHVVMSNIYAKLGKWKEVMKVRRRLRGLQVKKDPGCSWIEVRDAVHVFRVEDDAHPERDAIYSILEDLGSNIGSHFCLKHKLLNGCCSLS